MSVETKRITKARERIATKRLFDLVERAEVSRLYGAITVCVKFEDGVAQIVEYTFEGKDKQLI